jgi:hypothetical protein
MAFECPFPGPCPVTAASLHREPDPDSSLTFRLSASVRIKESHELARPMIHLDPRHKVTQEFVALHDTLA